jgi:hypothetical protein
MIHDEKNGRCQYAVIVDLWTGGHSFPFDGTFIVVIEDGTCNGVTFCCHKKFA